MTYPYAIGSQAANDYASMSGDGHRSHCTTETRLSLYSSYNNQRLSSTNTYDLRTVCNVLTRPHTIHNTQGQQFSHTGEQTL